MDNNCTYIYTYKYKQRLEVCMSEVDIKQRRDALLLRRLGERLEDSSSSKATIWWGKVSRTVKFYYRTVF